MISATANRHCRSPLRRPVGQMKASYAMLHCVVCHIMNGAACDNFDILLTLHFDNQYLLIYIALIRCEVCKRV